MFNTRIAILAFLLFACCEEKTEPYSQTGLASYYAAFFEGQTTSSGDAYDPDAMTAAHQFLPLGTEVRVTNLENNSSVNVLINDRGPYASSNRIIDLSRAAAEKLGFVEDGLTKVRIEVVKPAEGYEITDSIASGRLDAFRKWN